jgi:hypothetical protein
MDGPPVTWDAPADPAPPKAHLDWLPSLMGWALLLLWLAGVFVAMLLWATRNAAICGS